MEADHLYERKGTLRTVHLSQVMPGFGPGAARKIGLRFFVRFGGQVGATGYGVCVYIIYEHRAISCIGPRGQTGTHPYRGCSEIVRKSCNFSATPVQSLQPPHGNCTELVQLPCGGCAEKARRPCSLRAVFRRLLPLRSLKSRAFAVRSA